MSSRSNAIELEQAGGATIASYWITGSGRYIRRRPVPIWCAEYDRREVLDQTRGKTRSTVKKLLKAHPRAQSFIVVQDRRALNRWVKAKGGDV